MTRVFHAFLIWCFLPLSIAAQDDPGRSGSFIIPEEYSKIHQKGEQALLMKKYPEALKYFKKVLKKFPDFSPAMRGMGACQELIGNYEEAAEIYEKTLHTNPNFSRALYYECGKSFYQAGKYRKALSYFQRFDTLRNLSPLTFIYNGVEELTIEKEYYEKLPASLRACQVALDSIQFWNISSVFNMGKAINSEADEYFPFLFNDGNTLLYTSRKNENADENLFISTRPRGEWRIGEKIGNFNTEGNEGMTSLVRDNRKMYFTACQRPEVLGPCDIWVAHLEGTKIREKNPVIGYLNSGWWDSQASISCDGSHLFFASNREGGFGGTDIWLSRRMPDGRWSEPVNLGPNINTKGDEEAPFITNDGNVLYFSSTGHLGLGEQDIFMSRMQPDSSWGYAINLGMPVNSSYRELGLFLTADGKTGYFASNRKGGYGGMDIYFFHLPEKLSSDEITYVEGFVADSITNLPVKTTVHFKNRPPVQTDENGRFFLCVKARDTLHIQIRAEDYHGYRNDFVIPVWHNKVFYTINILLDPLFRLPVFNARIEEVIAIPTSFRELNQEARHSILFNFDSADLLPEELIKLNTFLENSISGKQILSVEVVGYADDIGTDIYNLILSEKRAKNVGILLKEKGIRVDKIYIEGKGIDRNDKPRWQNRRVDVIIQMVK